MQIYHLHHTTAHLSFRLSQNIAWPYVIVIRAITAPRLGEERKGVIHHADNRVGFFLCRQNL